MTKHSLENDIDELSEKLLTELSHEARLERFLEASAENKETWRERLLETTPRETYEQNDLGFTRRARLSHVMAQAAMEDLHSKELCYYWAKSVHQYSFHVTAIDEDLPPHPLVTVDGFSPDTFLARLYISYEVYQRFAESELGVSLETWLATVPKGAEVFEGVDAILDEEAALLLRRCEDPEIHDILGIDLPDDPDAEVEERYRRLAELYRATAE